MSKQLYPHPECMAPDGADPCEGYHQALNRIADLKRQLQELEAGQQWVSVEDKPPPTYTEVWIRGEGFEVLATLEQSNDEPGEEEFDWYPCFFEVGEPLYPTEWRYVTPPPEDSSGL